MSAHNRKMSILQRLGAFQPSVGSDFFLWRYLTTFFSFSWLSVSFPMSVFFLEFLGRVPILIATPQKLCWSSTYWPGRMQNEVSGHLQRAGHLPASTSFYQLLPAHLHYSLWSLWSWFRLLKATHENFLLPCSHVYVPEIASTQSHTVLSLEIYSQLFFECVELFSQSKCEASVKIMHSKSATLICKHP